MLTFSAFVADRQRVPVDDKGRAGADYRSLDSIVSDRFAFITNNGLYNYASTQTIDLFYSLAVLSRWLRSCQCIDGSACLRGVHHPERVAPMSAGGMLSMGQ